VDFCDSPGMHFQRSAHIEVLSEDEISAGSMGKGKKRTTFKNIGSLIFRDEAGVVYDPESAL